MTCSCGCAAGRRAAKCTCAHVAGDVQKDTDWIGGFLGGVWGWSLLRGEGWKCEGWLHRSPAGNQGEAGNESWGVLALLLSPFPALLASSPALLSDCRKAPARPLSKPNPFPPSLSSLSCRLSAWLCWTVVRMFPQLCFQPLAALSSAAMTSIMQGSEVARRRKENGVVRESLL